MRGIKTAAMAAMLGASLCCGLGALTNASAADPSSDAQQVYPVSSRKIVPLDQPGRPETALDGSTIYLNDHDVTGRYFVFGTTAPRRGDWGEHLNVVPNTPAPLQIRLIEFSLQVTATSTLVAEFDFWDAYNTAASPVNSGLLGIREGNYGIVPANTGGQFYSQVGLAWDSVPIPLADPSIFVEFKFKSSTGVSAPINVAMRPIADASELGPNLGTSENDVYADQNSDGIFTFSALNAGDRRLLSNTTVCGPTDCQTNWHLHIRGAPNPNTIEPGMDLYETPAAGATKWLDLLGPAFFDQDDNGIPCGPTAFSSSDPVTGNTVMQGVPLTTVPAGVLDPTDTIVLRTGAANLPTPGSQATIPVEIVALNLVSVAPITVTYDGGQSPTQWDLLICLSASPQTPGSMTITKGQCVGEGTYTESLPILPKLTFFPVSGASCPGPVTIDFGPQGFPPYVVTTANGHYMTDPPGSLPLITEPFAGDEVDGDCDSQTPTITLPTTTNFHPGVLVPRCPGDMACAPGQAVKRQIDKTGTQMVKGVFHAEVPSAIDSDLDGIEDIPDNCSIAANPLQEDVDDDSVGDACDNCVSVCNPEQSDSDSDDIGNACDNCPGTSNTLQENADADDFGDACDNCPADANNGQENADGDSFGDACDPCPLDASNTPPGPVNGVQYSVPPPNDDTLQWVPTAGASSYDVVRGSIGALPVGPGAGDETCSSEPGASHVDASMPGSGAGFFYVVRARNSCAPVNDYGNTHTNPGPPENGPARTTTTCP